MSNAQIADYGENPTRMRNVLQDQRRAFQAEGVPDVKTRVDRINRLIAMLVDNERKIIEAERADFCCKSEALIRLGEIFGTLSALRYARDRVVDWMKPERVELPAEHESLGMYAELHHRPLGTIGVISPWNGPIILSCMPLASIFSAGNRAMIKPSEFAPATAALLEQLVTANFDSSELAVINGDWQVAAAFAGLPFDHLLYTGSSRIAREVLKAAAENLVPVTLELGGKCPVIIGSGTQLDLAARRIVFGKLFHGGQVCVSPDYVFVPANQIQEFTRAVETAAAEMYPELEGSADYSPIVNSSHYQRLQDVITDAREQGTQILRLGSDPERSECRKALRFPFHLLLDPPEQTRAMHEELFGPIMVIKQYQQLDEAISYVRDHPKPLAGYFFGDDKQELALFLDTIQTGSVAVNDVVCQIFYEQIPFGGIGPSGNGRYRGVAGFRAFSNAMPVLTQAGSDGHLAPLRPPYGSGISDFLDQQIRVFY